MSEMVERVAEAIKECVADRCENMPEFWRVHARAAIEAMREPTQEMIASCPHEDAWHVWRDMMNVALDIPSQKYLDAETYGNLQDASERS